MERVTSSRLNSINTGAFSLDSRLNRVYFIRNEAMYILTFNPRIDSRQINRLFTFRISSHYN